MRRTSKIGRAGVAGLNALVVGSLLLAQGQPARAQRQGSETAGDAPVVPRSSAIAGRPADADKDQEARLLLVHGLEMAIEGSTLQGLSLRSAGVNPGPAIEPRPSPAGVVGSSSVATPVPAGSVVPRAAIPTSTVGTGFTGAAGETVSGRVVGNGNDIRPDTKVPGVPDGTQPGGLASGAGTPPSVGLAKLPMNADQSAELLQQHAQRSFEAADRLLNQAGATGTTDPRLQRAALRYAETLKALASQPVVKVAPGNTPPGSPPPATGAVATIGADPASVALINHGVKEALGSMKIQQMVRQMGGTSGPGGQQLMAHARQMDGSARSTIQAFAGNGSVNPVNSGSQNGPVQALAQQANDLIMAIQGNGLEGGNPGR